MKINDSKIKDLSIADIDVLLKESDKQIAQFSDGTDERNYHIALVTALAAEKKSRMDDLVEKEDDEKEETADVPTKTTVDASQKDDVEGSEPVTSSTTANTPAPVESEPVKGN